MNFSKVLIANRGEIAVRLIRACHSLGLQAVAVYSDADSQAVHVQIADEAVHIGAAEARHSYLDAQKLIQAARDTGAQAIHPGYGFLAENADFAQACADADIIFVGPSPQVIRSMGAKIEAKQIAEKAGVPCVPGFTASNPDDQMLIEAAQQIGTPLLIKASAGGGGRGMRRVDDLTQFESELKLARAEAEAAFGDAAILLERYITAPRHIEVQILADQHGNVRHLFERDCSIQRNYQKVIEEAPAPNLSPELRQQVLDNAVRLAEAIGYDNAGTVEFVVDANEQQAYFLEMNTRLQVEHPVTEMITGIDLAAWQLRIAAGEAISFAQNAVQCQGHAIEARVAAENPALNYQPETGQITKYEEPAGLRIDSGITRGSKISPYYDSMLAKAIAYADDRTVAIRKLQQGLNDYRIGGIGHNLGFLVDVLTLPAFQTGEHLTSTLTQAWPQGWSAPELTDRDYAHAALARHLDIQKQRSGSTSPWHSLGAWRLGENIGGFASTTWHVQNDTGDVFEVAVQGRAGRYAVIMSSGVVLDAQDVRYESGQLTYKEDAVNRQLAVSVDAQTVQLGSHTLNAYLPEDILLTESDAASPGGNAILAPTPGLISEVLVESGQRVSAGDPIVVLEAMKLFQQLTAPVDGEVIITCQTGDSVNSGDVLATIETGE